MIRQNDFDITDYDDGDGDNGDDDENYGEDGGSAPNG